FGFIMTAMFSEAFGAFQTIRFGIPACQADGRSCSIRMFAPEASQGMCASRIPLRLRNLQNFVRRRSNRAIDIGVRCLAQLLGDESEQYQQRYLSPMLVIHDHDLPQLQRLAPPDLLGKSLGDGEQSRPQLTVAQNLDSFILAIDGELPRRVGQAEPADLRKDVP